MYALLLTTLLSMPLYPLNPTSQDTVHMMNLHFTAGFNGPNTYVTAGPELTAKYEWVIKHPFILRGAFDYRFGKLSTTVFPKGNLHRGLISLEAMVYRGTDKLTGYVGGGVIYSMNYFKITSHAADSIMLASSVDDVRVDDRFGYRITAGLRIHRTYTIEIGITEVSPKFVYTQHMPDNRYTVSTEQFRFNDFRVSLGYLFTLKI